MAISKHDKQALADLFIDMGVPLVVAMQTVESWSGGDAQDVAQRAENLAKLLNVTVDFATKMTKKLDIRDSYMLENVRGKIIRIVTPIIAETYVTTGQIPVDTGLKDLTDLFDVLLSFADSLSPTNDSKDKPHNMALMIEACEPVLTAVREHSFGLDPEHLFHKLVEGVQSRTNGLAAELKIEDGLRSGLLKAVSGVYVSCYRNALARVESGAELSGDDAVGSIWADCDERLSLIRGLTRYVGDNVGLAMAKPDATLSKSADKPQRAANEPAAAVQNSDKEDGDDDFNPMAFFSAGGQ